MRDLTMAEIAKRAKVGKPTLYKWWPSKAALVMAMFHERIARKREVSGVKTTEQSIRSKVRRLIRELNGVFGKVIAELIAEGQSDPEILRDLRPADTDAELLIDAIFGSLYFRFLLRTAPLTESYGQELVDQVLRGLRGAVSR